MKNDGDKGTLGPAPDPASSPRITLVRSALHAAIAVIALVALATSIPHWGSDNFPVLSLVIYVAGMVFVAMPLCLCYEALLKSQQERTGNRGWSVNSVSR